MTSLNQLKPAAMLQDLPNHHILDFSTGSADILAVWYLNCYLGVPANSGSVLDINTVFFLSSVFADLIGSGC